MPTVCLLDFISFTMLASAYISFNSLLVHILCCPVISAVATQRHSLGFICPKHVVVFHLILLLSTSHIFFIRLLFRIFKVLKSIKTSIPSLYPIVYLMRSVIVVSYCYSKILKLFDSLEVVIANDDFLSNSVAVSVITACAHILCIVFIYH